jgi:ribosomal silencing factor RsfS
MRGCTDILKQNLNSDFEVSGIVKPGAKAKDILGTKIEEDMSTNDFIVVCAGTNDISKNGAKEGLKKT